MERSRSKRNYYYDQDYDGDSMARTKPRYNSNNNNHHHGFASGGGTNRFRGGNGRPPSRPQGDVNAMVTTSYRILCHDAKAGGVIGKSGSIIRSMRQHTGAWINVHELIPGDAERIIEISDTRRRDPDGRMPASSPAQEALLLIHDRILRSESQYGPGVVPPEEEEDYGGFRPGGGRVVTRLVVSRMHVGSLLGKGGKIIEQMRIETKTHIRILPRDDALPQCVSMSEEVVQVVGDTNAVKAAVRIISSRLRESQHRDRSNFHGRRHSPERFSLPGDDYIPQRQQSLDRFSNVNYRNNSYPSRQSNYAIESGMGPMGENLQAFNGEELVFQMLCPVNRVPCIVGESEGITDLLQNEVGVDIRVTDPRAGSDEQIIVISSEEAPDDELFPAQEALLHIQTRIADLIPDKENIVTTRLLVPSSDIRCLDGKDGPFSLSEIRRLTGANVQILPRDDHPSCVSECDEIVQIVGEIKAARNALVELTSRLKSHLYKELFQKETTVASSPATVTQDGAVGVEVASSNNLAPSRDGRVFATSQSLQGVPVPLPSKDAGGSETAKPTKSEQREDVPSAANRFPVPLVTRSTLEVVLPEQVVPKLITKSRNKLAQISEFSGANVSLVEDRPEETQKIIRISGTPEQAERAQSLLQGFILSTQEDGP